MKKIDKIEMLNINGGLNCVYHAIAAVFIYTNPITAGIDYFWGSNGTSLSQCLSNSH
ncbi:hypothetical protein [Flavobacterium granuli]|uniref:Uncharacterized protein n=1 Tax=Flavobacterium granuli TaxID=280093 RepID=A0A1M5U2J3_9FLAO|nr:hypothetical protein [Flavobacterium granuli]PRZ19596.1 hypothetical protein BC624_11515 [Flavobacterium granuli]SHH57247.1 hypothetical protein SAMN05443373_11715 [Flavobacterium granuli]